MSELTPIPFRPMGIIKMVLEGLGYQVTYCYEDLIFIEHNAFLLRMEERGEAVSILFNAESEPDKRPGIAEAIATAGGTANLAFTRQGTYVMIPTTDESSFSIEFREGEF